MAFPAAGPSAAMDDPDSQMAWPGRGDQTSPTSPTSPIRFQEPLPNFRGSRADGRVEEDLVSSSQAAEPTRPRRRPSDSTPKSKLVKRMTLKDFVLISISMLGAQITWTVELGYGTPFLLSLGLSEQVTSLVWLAGPVSGLVAQPLIGAISDSSNSKYRRRYWICLATVVLIISTLGLAYAKPIAALVVDIFAGGQGDWDPKREAQIASTAIGCAVLCFYLLDFALNALQASLRNLLLDLTPGDQLATGNAWHGRMIHAGNIIGFTFGFLDLAHWPILRELGGDQFRKVCIVAMIILVITVWITCATQHEEAREEDIRSRGSRTRDVMGNIFKSIAELPKPVRRVCYVQLFAFMGWFPFLFYSTTWVGEVLAYEIGEEPTTDDATRAGEFAMLLYSIVSVAAGTLLPYLAARDRRLLAEKEDEAVDAEISRIRLMVQSWKREAARMGKPLHLPTMPFMLRNIWTSALVLFGIVMMSTFFITKVWQATVAICVLGICWAVACWVPFAIIMEFLKELDQAAKANTNRATRVAPSLGRPGHARVSSTPAIWRGIVDNDERTSLIRRQSLGHDYEAANEMNENKKPVAGGTILGIHNLAIVIPQFIIALVASAIFRIVDNQQEGNENVYYGKNGVAWVLRFGGFCALIGAFVSRGVPPTKTERAMRRRLAEMEADNSESH